MPPTIPRRDGRDRLRHACASAGRPAAGVSRTDGARVTRTAIGVRTLAPDPRFVAALEERLVTALAAPAPARPPRGPAAAAPWPRRRLGQLAMVATATLTLGLGAVAFGAAAPTGFPAASSVAHRTDTPRGPTLTATRFAPSAASTAVPLALGVAVGGEG